jgi:uncharacterized protein HemY
LFLEFVLGVFLGLVGARQACNVGGKCVVVGLSFALVALLLAVLLLLLLLAGLHAVKASCWAWQRRDL